MPKPQHEDGSFRERLEQAGAWRARLAMAGVSESAEFDAWLHADARNAQAWEDSRRSWDIFTERQSDPAMADAVRAAHDLARADRARRRRVTRLAGGIAACLVLAVGAVVGTTAYRQRPQAFETADARREIQLADGSRVSLDAQTLLKVRFTGDRRDLELVRGQAVFDVAHDASRPFAVKAGDRRVIATGTRFNIDMLAGATKITLMEGRVLVQRLAPRSISAPKPEPESAETVALQPGQQLTAEASAEAGTPEVQVARVDTSKALAWKGGQLVFEDEPLADVVDRVSRYSDTKVSVRDPALAQHRISGVFVTGDVATFLDAVEQHLAVQAVQVSPGRVELRRKPG